MLSGFPVYQTAPGSQIHSDRKWAVAGPGEWRMGSYVFMAIHLQDEHCTKMQVVTVHQHECI